jgi:hypothetical protein
MVQRFRFLMEQQDLQIRVAEGAVEVLLQVRPEVQAAVAL